MQINPIAEIHTSFPEKFGIPRQSGLVETMGKIVFRDEYRNPDALKGLEGYSHLWLIWGFSLNNAKKWSPTVRPPRLGGNKRIGVFATRSPFRPNSLGLSCVKIHSIVKEKLGMVIYVLGADLADGTPIYDIKPYLAYTDSHPDAKGGFAEERKDYSLEVSISCNADIPQEKLDLIKQIISNDPRPAYKNDPERVYKMSVLGYNVEFKADGKNAVITNIFHPKKGM